jgi:hypothetical protein
MIQILFVINQLPGKYILEKRFLQAKIHPWSSLAKGVKSQRKDKRLKADYQLLKQ